MKKATGHSCFVWPVAGRSRFGIYRQGQCVLKPRAAAAPGMVCVDSAASDATGPFLPPFPQVTVF